MHHLHLLVHGRVQGVGFRYFVLREASSLALTGTVRNLSDGSVEVVAEGGRIALEQLLAVVQRGPLGAEVIRVDVEWAEGPRRFDAFRVRP
jgi:acylphosphatase